MNKPNLENKKFKQTINMIPEENLPINFNLHWHKFVEIISFPEAKGSAHPVIAVNQNNYTLSSGDVLLIWPGEPHEVISNPEKQLLGFQFPIYLFNEIPDFAPYLNMLRTYRHVQAAEEPALSQTLISYLRHMKQIHSSDTPFPTVEMVICLYEMFMELSRYVETKVSPMADRALEKIDLACRYIQENCTSGDISLDTVAGYIGFSPCYFSRLFKQTTHYSFVDYLNLQRVKQAQTLLNDSSLNVTEISYQAGFKSISTFNRVFRQCRGCSPSEYRKYYSEDHR